MNDARKEEKRNIHTFFTNSNQGRRFIISTSVFTPAELILKKGDESH